VKRGFIFPPSFCVYTLCSLGRIKKKDFGRLYCLQIQESQFNYRIDTFITNIGTHLRDNVARQIEGNSMKSTWFRVLKQINIQEELQVDLVALLLNDQYISKTYVRDAILSTW
jgi:hypothetical protein